jgi:hypothetical protein
MHVGRDSRNVFIALVLAIGAVLLIQTRSRGIDPDELEHLHAACAVSWGEVPYRDFFEHHGPGLFYMLQPILWMTGAALPALWWSRFLMWGIGMATLALTGATAYRLAGDCPNFRLSENGTVSFDMRRTAAAIAPALLGCTTIFFWKTVEVRPDVPAMFLLTLAAYVMVAAPKRSSPFAALLIGFLLGLATLFTQKAIVPAAALILAQLALCCRDRQTACGFAPYSRKTTLRYCVLIVLGGMAAWLIALGLFYFAGAWEAFLQATVYQLWIWPVRQSPLTALRPTLLSDLPLWIGAAMAIIASIQDVCTSAAQTDASQVQRYGRVVLSLAVLACFIGGLFVQASYSQYYLLWFPLAAIVAADWLVRQGTIPQFVSTTRGLSPPASAITPRAYWTFAGLLGILVVFEAFMAAHAANRGADGALPHLLDRFSTLAIDVFALGFIPLVAIAVAVCLARRRRAGVVLWLAVLGFGYAGLRNLDVLCWSNREQVALIATVDRLVGPDETVFDGFTGLGVFRRHAYYYWWLNPYSLNLMEGESREPRLLASLKRSPPKLICVDENVEKLPGVMEWVEENYRPIEPPLYLRKDSVTAPVRGRGG